MIKKRYKHYHTNHVVEVYDAKNMVLIGAETLTLIPNEVILNGQDWSVIVPVAIKYNGVLYKKNNRQQWQAAIFLPDDVAGEPIWDEEELPKEEVEC